MLEHSQKFRLKFVKKLPVKIKFYDLEKFAFQLKKAING